MSKSRHTTAESGLPRLIGRKLRATRRVLGYERLARAFWPLWVIAAAALALAISGAWPFFPLVWRFILGGGLGLAALYFLWRGWRRYQKPTRLEALRALDSELARRPVENLDDHLPEGASPPAKALWRANREKLRARAKAARIPSFNPGLAKVDGWGLRFLALPLLFVGILANRTDLDEKLAASLAIPANAAALEPASIEAWATPPSYTGLPPIYLTEMRDGAQGDAPIALPAGSKLTVRASGLYGGAALELDGLTDAPVAPVEEAPGAYALEFEITKDGRIALSPMNGAALGAWRFAAAPDTPPQIEVSEAPAPTAERALGFSFIARDDYAVTAARARITLDPAPDAAAKPYGEAIEFDLPLPFADAQEAPNPVAEDFTEHPWAGMPVSMILTAEDALGQSASAEPVKFTLPERLFAEPMARAFIEQRRNLAGDIRKAARTVDILEAVIDYPDDYFTDPAAFMIANSGVKRLYYAEEEGNELKERPAILEAFWRAALKLEEGDLENLLERLKRAQQRLAQAMEDGASDEELEQLMDELRGAIEDYMEALARQALENPDQLAQNQEGQQQLGVNELEKLLEQLEKAAKSGARSEAEQMLSMLDEMMKNLQFSRSQGNGDQQQGQQNQGQGGPLDQLQEMMRRQQELADETFRNLQGNESQPGQGDSGQRDPGMRQGRGEGDGQTQEHNEQGQGGAGQGESGREGQGQTGSGRSGLAQRQEGLRDDLEGLMPGLSGQRGEDPGAIDPGEALERAERAMRGARDDLAEGDLQGGLEGQIRALDEMREGARSLSEQERQARREAQRGEGQQGQQQGGRGQGGGQDRDPFGRVTGVDGPDDGLGVKVPGARAKSRAREIQRELRRRSGERERPQRELDYLDRLQKRF